MADDVLRRLTAWYAAQCDGDWEHGLGVDIGTLDNPGWRVRVNLEGTALEGRERERSEVHRTEDDWVVTWLEGGSFHAACGPFNLEEALTAFLEWAADAPVSG